MKSDKIINFLFMSQWKKMKESFHEFTNVIWWLSNIGKK